VDEVVLFGDPVHGYDAPLPGVPYLQAEKKIQNITACDWFIVVDPASFLPDPCTWWEVLDPTTGDATGLEFHVDQTDGITLFHIDGTLPDVVITIPPSYTITVRQKIDDITQCDWFKVVTPEPDPPIPCTWWEILDPTTLEPTGWEFHVDDVTSGYFHVDNVIPGPSALPLAHEYHAERKIPGIRPCDWFMVTDPPTGWGPEPCSWWQVTSPPWTGTIFHVDQGGPWFHVDYVNPPTTIVTPPPYEVTAIPYEPPPPPWYKKPPYPDYAPSGMPDFDQKQDNWGPGQGIYTWCGPVAVANSLWWFDSEYETNTIPPPTIIDNYNLVTAYGAWDDHDPRNVDPFVVNLAFLMDTDGIRTGLTHTGTSFWDMETGISQYLQQQGLNPVGDADGDGDVDDDDLAIIEAAYGSTPGHPAWDMRADVVVDNVIDMQDLSTAGHNHGLSGEFYEHTEEFANFTWIEDEIYRCEDVVLFLEFWYFDEIEWVPLYDNPSLENGHFVTCAGVNSTAYELLVSDPYWDAAEAGFPGHIPRPHPGHADPTVHNDTQYVSHDAYGAALWMGPPPPSYPPVILWELVGYLQQLGYGPYWHAFIRAAVVTSPLKYFPWDVTGDGYVGIDDIVAVAEHFGEDPTDPDWDPKYDITGDDYVGIDDIVAVAEHFGEQDP
jgi:hypothetical protein